MPAQVRLRGLRVAQIHVAHKFSHSCKAPVQRDVAIRSPNRLSYLHLKGSASGIQNHYVNAKMSALRELKTRVSIDPR